MRVTVSKMFARDPRKYFRFNRARISFGLTPHRYAFRTFHRLSSSQQQTLKMISPLLGKNWAIARAARYLSRRAAVPN